LVVEGSAEGVFIIAIDEQMQARTPAMIRRSLRVESQNLRTLTD
jgi:hypothetical protein